MASDNWADGLTTTPPNQGGDKPEIVAAEEAAHTSTTGHFDHHEAGVVLDNVNSMEEKDIQTLGTPLLQQENFSWCHRKWMSN
jgi:hypothetical protein